MHPTSKIMSVEPQYTKLSDGEESFDPSHLVTYATNQWRRRFWILLFISCLTQLLWVAIIVKQTTSIYHPFGEGTNLPYSPARSSLRYESRYLHKDPDSARFMGKPRPEMDQAWHELMEGTLIRYSPEELKQAGNATSIALKDGGYAGGLGVGHELHCLKRIKQYLYPDYYLTHGKQDWPELEAHADHCLETLRQALLCRPDISVYTFQWTHHSHSKPSVLVPQAHTCVDWSKLHSWMKGRAANFEDMVRPDPSWFEEQPKNENEM